MLLSLMLFGCASAGQVRVERLPPTEFRGGALAIVIAYEARDVDRDVVFSVVQLNAITTTSSATHTADKSEKANILLGNLRSGESKIS
jgi:hypothetical protein